MRKTTSSSARCSVPVFLKCRYSSFLIMHKLR
jgi:hypothetical protein